MTRAFDVSKFRKGITKNIAGISTGFNDPTTWLSTGSYGLNYLISGDFYKGIPMGKVTVLAGESGCLPADAMVSPYIDGKYYLMTVATLRDKVKSGETIYLSTPDGVQQVTEWFDKGVLDIVKVTTSSGSSTRCAVNHMLELADGHWSLASDLKVGMTVKTQLSDADPVIAVTECPAEECYDFTIDHPNHRYWGDGFSSHNSGKSFIASGNIIKSAQEQDIFTVLIDSENSLDQRWLVALGVDTSEDKLLRISASIIDDVAKIIGDFVKDYKANYAELPKEDRPMVLFVIDSLGMLLSATDVNQFQSGDMKGDMGRKAKQLKALVTNCLNMFGDLNIGLVATAHTYESQDMYSNDLVVSGGCLVAGTGVKTPHGIKQIQDLTVGDVVLTLEGDKQVSQVFEYEKETFDLVLEDGTTITATPEHRFMVKSDSGYTWKTVAELAEGESIVVCSQ